MDSKRNPFNLIFSPTDVPFSLLAISRDIIKVQCFYTGYIWTDISLHIHSIRPVFKTIAMSNFQCNNVSSCGPALHLSTPGKGPGYL